MMVLYLMMIADKSLTESLREIVLVESALTSSLREPTVISIASVTAFLIASERLSAMLERSGVFGVACCDVVLSLWRSAGQADAADGGRPGVGPGGGSGGGP